MADGYPIVAALTQAMVDRVQTAISLSGGPVAHAKVTANRPEELGQHSAPQVNLYLYHVTPSPFRRNENQPTRSAAGNLTNQPVLALDLHYLVSFYGAGAQSRDSQLLMGLVMGVLELDPVFPPEALLQAWHRLNHDAPLDGALAVMDEPVRLDPVSVDVEAMHRLWQLFPNVPYTLSAIYRASTSMLPAGPSTPAPAPVRGRNASGGAMGAAPSVASFVSSAGAGNPLAAGDSLIMTGSNLALPGLVVEIGGHSFTPSSVTATRVEVPLTGRDVPIGVPMPLNLVSVQNQTRGGSYPFRLTGGIVPSLSLTQNSVTAGTDIYVQCHPVPHGLTKVALTLTGAKGKGSILLAAQRMTVQDDTATIGFASDRVPAGKWVVMITLPTPHGTGGSVRSVPDWANGQYTGPILTVTAAAAAPSGGGGSP